MIWRHVILGALLPALVNWASIARHGRSVDLNRACLDVRIDPQETQDVDHSRGVGGLFVSSLLSRIMSVRRLGVFISRCGRSGVIWVVVLLHVLICH